MESLELASCVGDGDPLPETLLPVYTEIYSLCVLQLKTSAKSKSSSHWNHPYNFLCLLAACNFKSPLHLLLRAGEIAEKPSTIFVPTTAPTWISFTKPLSCRNPLLNKSSESTVKNAVVIVPETHRLLRLERLQPNTTVAPSLNNVFPNLQRL
ncbi:hypothetical protein U1Q18_052499 [Sarracenia purpurea var. burkii]